ncbi:Type I restriction-modification system, specificity subunit S [Lunatimonas lonarensis]|uniref:Type I restriction-modification system, specificity subunit S n=1 Tax=Lunatimonas lonarensis TaxID=1232681 RepID=R7ZUP2_9BACT|nr:restriction endonuclease subunit S [Lunatimonas lonarensis]EON77694.1 Type I restriction-modification system, specificity subunit S [Lunatimonas lonarensis]
MKKYESYKDSGLDWIGEIPSGWIISKLKFYANIYTGNSLNDSQKIEFESEDFESLSYVASKDVDVNTTKVNYNNGTRIPRENPNFKIAPANSSLLCIEGGSAGKKMTFLNQDVCFVNKLACIDLENKWLSKFVFYFLKSETFQKQFTESLAGLIGGVSITNLRNFLVPIPPNFDALEISRFLDHHTSLIDELIDKKQRLIQKLEEKRKSVINEAVTKGLNPSVQMKDSGIDWIGEIPEHWSLAKLKYLVSMKSGSSITSESIEDAGTYPVYGGNGLRGYTESFTNEGEYVLIGRQGALCGNINYASGKFWASEHAVVVYPNSEMDTFYLGELLRLMDLNQYSESAAQPGISVGKILNLSVPKISFSEQVEISLYLKDKLSRIEILKDKLKIQLDRILKYRQSIISEAVTGKIDVRNWEPSI